MKKISLLGLALCGALLILTGCGTVNPQSFVSAMGTDHAFDQLIYSGAYGPLTITRANPLPGQTIQKNVDGSFTMGWDTNYVYVVSGTNYTMRPLMSTNTTATLRK